MAVSKLNPVSSTSLPPAATAKLFSGVSNNGVATVSLSAGNYAIKAIAGGANPIGRSTWSAGSSYLNTNRVTIGPASSDSTVYTTLSTSDTDFAITSTGFARRYSAFSGITQGVSSSFVYGNGKYCSAVYDGTNWYFVSSPNGINWTTGTGVANSTMGSPGTTLSMVAALNNMYFMGGNGGPIQYSSDGITFSGAGTNLSLILRDMAFGAGVFVVVSSSGSNTSNIASSTNGSTWTARNSGILNAINGVAFGNSIFVAISTSGRITTSTDGTTWSATTPMTGTLTSITFGNGKFLVINSLGNMWTSTDGTTWTASVTADGFERLTPLTIKALSFGGGRYWLSGVDSLHGFQYSLSSSTDGITWTRTYSAISDTGSAETHNTLNPPGPTAYGDRLLSLNRNNASTAPQVIEYPPIAYEIYSVA
jgi:hypothetical protein